MRHSLFSVGEWGAVDGHRLRRVGTVHLGLAGVVNSVTGVVLVFLATSGRLASWVFTEHGRFITAQELVQESPTILFAATTGAVIIGIVLVALGTAGIVVTYRRFQGRDTKRSSSVVVASAINPLTLPLSFVSGVLTWLAVRLGETDQ
jgi:hypothetical protein